MRKKISTLATAGGLALASLPMMLPATAQAMDGRIGLHFADHGDYGNGIGLHGRIDPTVAINDTRLPLRLEGRFTDTDELSILGGRIAYKFQTDSISTFLGGGYQYWDFDMPIFRPEASLLVGNDDAWTLHALAEYPVGDQLVLGGGVEMLFFDNLDDETAMVSLSGEYQFNANFSTGIDVEIYADDPVDQVFVRLGAAWHW